MILLDAIRERMLFGTFPGEAIVVDGRFWPMSAAPLHIRSSDTIKRHLKAAGYATPSPERDGYWVLTEAGREWLSAGTKTRGGE